MQIAHQARTHKQCAHTHWPIALRVLTHLCKLPSQQLSSQLLQALHSVVHGEL